jgi:hypothetical protein
MQSFEAAARKGRAGRHPRVANNYFIFRAGRRGIFIDKQAALCCVAGRISRPVFSLQNKEPSS